MLRYAITDRRLLAPAPRPGVSSEQKHAHGLRCEREDSLVALAAALAARGDIDYLQLREKDLPPAQLASLARRILEAIRKYSSGEAKRLRRPKLLINARADIAIAISADGVHLTASPGELAPAEVRQLYSAAGLPPPIVSLSCHTLAEVLAARGARGGFGSGDTLCFAPNPATTPDLILFGPVFEKQGGGQLISKGSGLELLRQACAAASPIPVLALGGITEDNASDCVAAGAAGYAAIRAFCPMAGESGPAGC